MIIEISVAVIAVFFAVLVIYLIQTLRNLNLSLLQARYQIEELSDEMKEALKEVNAISANIHQKVESFDPIFKAVNQVGELFEQQVNQLKENGIAQESFNCQQHSYVRQQAQKEKSFTSHEIADSKTLANIGAMLELTGLGIRLWQTLKRR